MRSLIDLYVHTGEDRFLEPIPRALSWAKRSLLPDGRLARFYELRTNTPLYFVRDTYVLTYSDADMPTHYAFKVSGEQRIASIESYLARIQDRGREALKSDNLERWSGSVTEEDHVVVSRILSQLDGKGRWVEDGELRSPKRGEPRIPARVIRCRTFNRNLRQLARFVALTE